MHVVPILQFVVEHGSTRHCTGLGQSVGLGPSSMAIHVAVHAPLDRGRKAQGENNISFHIIEMLFFYFATCDDCGLVVLCNVVLLHTNNYFDI